MTNAEIITLLPGLLALDCYPALAPDGSKLEVPYLFSAKTRFNLAKNIVVASKVQDDLEKKRQAIRKKYLDEAGIFMKEKTAEATAELQAFADQESEAKLLRIAQSDLVCDDQPVPASVIAILLPIIDESPTSEPSA